MERKMEMRYQPKITHLCVALLSYLNWVILYFAESLLVVITYSNNYK